MSGYQLWRFRLIASTVLVTVSAAQQARAQGSDPALRMNAIEGQIHSLQDELRSMRRELAARDGQMRAAQRDAAAARADARRNQVAAVPAPTATPRPMASNAPGGPPQLDVAPSPGVPENPGSSGGQVTAGQQNASTTPGPTPMGTFKLGGVTVTLGGFIEAAAIARSRNEVADIASSLNTGIPFPQSPQYHEQEFRGSGRQSRLSLLVTGDIDPKQKLTGYFETDFQGAAPTANSVESNSYNLRLRQAYATYDNTDWGFHVLAGQSWSLATPQRIGLTPRQEDIPLTIDAQYVAGFNWTRQPQLRVSGDLFDHKLWAGLSFESPQAVFSVGPNGAGTIGGTANTTNPGGSGFSSGTNYSSDVAPDVIAKLAWDPGFGHYEMYGIARLLHDRVSTVGDGRNHTVLAGGGGASTVIPIVGKTLEFHGNVLAGYGIGRYGSAQLPDATLSQSGSPIPLPQISALAGLVYHPGPSVDVYAYAGTEQVQRRSFTQGGKGYGYGSPLYVNTGCYVELSASPCQPNTSGIVEGTLGTWWRFLHGSYGTAQVGGQYEYIRRSIFGGVGGSKGTDENVLMLSFRYLPFQ